VLGEALEPLLARCEVAEERDRLPAILERTRRATFESVSDVVGIVDTRQACVARMAALRESVPVTASAVGSIPAGSCRVGS
jgi:dihydropteroate synthase